MLLTLRGTPVLYQGDEIGLGDVDVPQDRLRDPMGVRYWPHYAGRDAMRTPMHWSPAFRTVASLPTASPRGFRWATWARSTSTSQRDDLSFRASR